MVTRLLVGTDKGLFRLHRPRLGQPWNIEGPLLPGQSVLAMARHPRRPGSWLAAARHPVWGAHLYASDDDGSQWRSLDSVPLHPEHRHASRFESVWGLTWSADGARLYAGIDPAGLFASDDDGGRWQDLPGLNDHPTRHQWQPARHLFAAHSLCIHPAHPDWLIVAISSGGAYRSMDGGQSWLPANAGVRAGHLPEPYPQVGHNVHRIVMHGGSGRLYRQCYTGTYRSDDWGQTWQEITSGLPGDFGYAVAVDPGDPDRVFQVPESSADLRIVVDARLRVFRSEDGGTRWSSASNGLPQAHAYVTVLREALHTAEGSPCSVWLGTATGHLFGSDDGGEHWHLLAAFLPRILCLRTIPA